MDKEYLKKVIEKIYSIDCKKNDCQTCKSDLEWCPKSYADEISKGLKLINRNLNKCKNIIKEQKL